MIQLLKEGDLKVEAVLPEINRRLKQLSILISTLSNLSLRTVDNIILQSLLQF